MGLSVEVSDDTLREGMQTPGLMFSIEEKLTIAQAPKEAGVRRMVVAHPPAHVSEVEATREIVRRVTDVKVFGLGRALRSDVDAIASTGANVSIHLPFEGGYERALEACKYTKDRYPNLELSVGLVDVSSYSHERLVRTAVEFEGAGADVIELPDTTGRLTPRRYGDLVRRVREAVSCKLSVHCHDDRGLAVANSLAGVEAGAELVEAAVMGLGERNGIAD
ncbi:hypothetical protein [Sulfodiicoccus acidiphilus]|uniref:hypothetical protein n=1 Tax=Sulfodiicoccus acidiphilus TaxID=1670455 RepID=UPI000F836AA4|nr:hypothetical protein [Sulfodiicoccus acidiphilus]